MNFEACFRLLAARLKEEIIVTSAGNSSELWWEITHETERVFYLEASMSLASVFAAGIALGARTHGGRIQRRRRVLHESRDAAGGAPTGAAQSQAFRDLEPGATAQPTTSAIRSASSWTTPGWRRRQASNAFTISPRMEGLGQGLDDMMQGPRARLRGTARRSARPAPALASARRTGGEVPLRPLSRTHRRTAGVRHAAASQMSRRGSSA